MVIYSTMMTYGNLAAEAFLRLSKRHNQRIQPDAQKTAHR
jgi:uncharacterized protein YaaW (UPF0174 family)